MANRKINELSVRTPSLTDLMIVGDPSTGYSFKATLAALNTLIDSSTSIGDLNGVVITSPTNGQALVYNGTNWVNQSISVPVTSVFGRTGAVVATEGDYSLDLLSDVTLTTPSSNQVLQYNGTAWVNATLTDNGITSLNGLTALSQTFATGSSGTDFAISSTTSTHTFNLPTASAVNRGALSSADWSTFNAKQNAITLTTTGSSGSATLVGATLNIPTYTLSGLGGISGSGTSGQVAYWTGTSSQSGSSTFLFSPTSELDLANSVTASGAIARGGRIRPTLVAAANNDVLVGLDINPTFTNGAFTGIRNFGLRVTTANGVEAARFTSPSGQFLIMPRLSSIYGAYLQSLDAAGTATQPLSFSSNKFVFESGNVLINQTTDSGQRLQVTGNAIVNGTLSVDNTSFTGSAATLTKTANNTFRIQGSGIGDNITFGPTNRIFLNTNEVVAQASIAVGTSITGNIANSTGLLINNNQLTQSNDTRTGLTLMTKTWRNDGAGLTSTINAVQISPTADMTLGTTIGTVLLLNPTINTTGGTSTLRGLYYNPTLTSTTGATHIAIQTVTGDVLLSTTSGNVGVGNTTPFSGATVSASVELGAFSANNGNLIVRGYSSLGGLQNNAYGAVGSNYYLDASNALRRKNADLVSTLEFASGFRFSTAGNGAANSVISLTELMRLNSNGNLLLGTTTDAGYKLDVNGSARFSQTTYITGGGLQVLGGMSSPTGNGGFELEYSAGIAYVTAYNRTSFSWVPINIRSSYTSFTTSNVERMRLVDGGLGIGTTSPNASAILELSSTTKGFLPPKGTNAQMLAIASPVSGLVFYDTTNNKLNVYDGTNWVAVH